MLSVYCFEIMSLKFRLFSFLVKISRKQRTGELVHLNPYMRAELCRSDPTTHMGGIHLVRRCRVERT